MFVPYDCASNSTCRHKISGGNARKRISEDVQYLHTFSFTALEHPRTLKSVTGGTSHGSNPFRCAVRYGSKRSRAFLWNSKSHNGIFRKGVNPG